MGFVQTAFLAALGAVAIPIIVHLIYRRRARRVDLGTIRFLKLILHENARWRRTQRWLLLAMRMAAVALLALLFARPYLLAQQGGGRERFIAILIDRSASMAAEDQDGRLLDQAVAAARRIMSGADSETQVEVAFFDHAVHAVGAEGNEQNSPPAEIEAPEFTYAATDYGAALAWAHDVCVQSPHLRREVHLLTDLQRSGLDWTAADPLPEDVQFFLHDFGATAPNNVGITGARVPRTLIRPGETVSATVTVFNGGPFPLDDVPVVLTLESGTRRHRVREQLNLQPGATATADFEVPGVEAGLWQGTAEIEVMDDLAFDNRRYLAVMSAPRLKTLLVDGDPQGAALGSETYFLDAALRLAPPGEVSPESAFDPRRADVSQAGELPDPGDADLVVLANVPGVDPDEAQRLKSFVKRGGGLLVFTGDKVEAQNYVDLLEAGLGVGAIEGIRHTHDLPARLWSWDEGHPLFAPFRDPQHGDLRRLAFYAFTLIEPSDDVRVLARFRGGEAALLEKRVGEGRVLWFASASDGEWGNWTRSRLYLPFVHQMLAYLAGLAEGGPVREMLLDGTGGNGATPGIHQRDGYWQVVNTSPRESETDRCSREEFAERFNLQLNELTEARAESTPRRAASSMELRDDEIWHWGIFALVGLLMVESVVANRTPA